MAVFCDRDGTLVREVPYLHDPARLELLPGAAGALTALARAGFALVVVTNQSGLARGYYGEDAVAAVHERMADLLAEAGVHLDGVYWCPHHPDGVVAGWAHTCTCRKPGSGMLEAAAIDLGLDLASSWLIGNTPSDIGAARAAGVTPLFVRTGHGASVPPPPDVPSFASLADAAGAVLATTAHRSGRGKPGPPRP